MKGYERTLIVLAVLVVLGALGVWALNHQPNSRESGEGGVIAADEGKPPSAPLGQFTPLAPPLPAPAVGFTARDGSPLQLADFRGRWVLVNLWATWCEPCVREMPSLDRLQGKLGDRLAVLAISEDRGAAHVVDPFLEKLELKNLAIYLDPKSAVGQALGVRGLPTTVLIDAGGQIVARLEGEAKWDGPDMQAKLERAMRGGSAASAH